MYKYNCFFEDIDFLMHARLKTFIEEDNHGFYIDIFINQQDVLNLIKVGVRPYWSSSHQHYYIRVNLNNNTAILANGQRLTGFADEIITNAPSRKDILLKELSLSRYKTERYDRQCYANKMIFVIPNSRKQR